MWHARRTSPGQDAITPRLNRCLLGRLQQFEDAAAFRATIFEQAEMTWTAERRFGLIHGEGRLARGSESAPTTRYVYGRAIEPGAAGEAKARKLTLAYQVLEEAAAP